MTEIGFNQSADVTAKLKTLDDAFAGQLINMAIGNDKLEQMFAQDPSFQKEQFEGKPTMVIAKELGIIKSDVSDALLVLQAGVRTYNNAVSAKAALKGEAVTTRKLDELSVDFMDEDKFDPRFRALKFGGSAEVVNAQASYAISQFVLNKIVGIKQYLDGNQDLKSDREDTLNRHLSDMTTNIEISEKHGVLTMKRAIDVLEQAEIIKPEFLAEIKGLTSAVTSQNHADIKGVPNDIARADIDDALSADWEEYKQISASHVPEPKLMYFLEELTRPVQNPSALAPHPFPK